MSGVVKVIKFVKFVKIVIGITYNKQKSQHEKKERSWESNS